MTLNNALKLLNEFMDEFNSNYTDATQLEIADVDGGNTVINVNLHVNDYSYAINIHFFEDEDLKIEIYEQAYEVLSNESLFKFLFFEAHARIEKGWV